MKLIGNIPLTNSKGREVEFPSSESIQKQRECKTREYCFLCSKCQDNTVFQVLFCWHLDVGGVKPTVAVSKHLHCHASKNILLEVSVEQEQA